ncbi:hypothetical protein BC833DRAFT_64429 [Globomyces pollinis-pini]|nr:hypothetical protein BC833DRAFT_64429 [Globomyces pollinis-pini]
MKQESDDIPQKASSNWAQEPSSSKTPKAAAKPTPARVLVIKSKTTAVGASSQWAGARTKPKERKPAPVEFRNGIGALVRNDSQNSLHSNSSQSDNSLAPTPSQSSSKPTLKDAITKPTKSVLASSELFPELPTVNKKPTRATSSRQRNAPSSTPPSKWGNNDQQEEFSEVQSSSKKKGKQVLIHFG